MVQVNTPDTIMIHFMFPTIEFIAAPLDCFVAVTEAGFQKGLLQFILVESRATQAS